MERLSKPTPSEQNRLKDLKLELSLVLKAKEKNGIAVSVDSNRSSARVIIDPATGLPATNDADHRQDASGSSQSANVPNPPITGPNSRTTMNWFGPDGKLLEPEKSFYYHPIFNPFGVPPPGMPMRMKDCSETPNGTFPTSVESVSTHQATDEETKVVSSPAEIPPAKQASEKEAGSENESDKEESEAEETEEDEDEIPLPEGSPPQSNGEDDSDDDIPLPEGPPPPQSSQLARPEQLINRPMKVSESARNPYSYPHPGPLRPPPFFPTPITLAPGVPPPPIIAGLGLVPFPMGPNGLPLPPPSINHLHSLPSPLPSAKLPAKPDIPSATGPPQVVPPPHNKPSPVVHASATVTALPQLRDLKREATSFVPAAIRKKRKELDRRAGLAGLGDSNRIQAAPEAFNDAKQHDTSSGSPDGNQSNSKQPKQLTTSLLAALKRDGVVSDTPLLKGPHAAMNSEKDDYDKFVESLGDVL